MENQHSEQKAIELCEKCADVCTTNAEKCREEGLDDCARLCMECAIACNNVVDQEGKVDPDLLKKCADACGACAAKCEAHDNQHCTECAKICRECQEACYSAMD